MMTPEQAREVLSMHFKVTINHGEHVYDAIAAHSFDAHAEAIDLFGVCAVSVRRVGS